jgi:hypothetical protein
LLNPFAGVAAIVVHSQLLSSSSSFKNSSSFLRSPMSQWKRPVDHRRAPEIHTLRLVPGVSKALLLTPAHPAKVHPGVGLQLGLILGKRLLPLQHLYDLFETFSLLFGIFGRWDGAGSSPALRDRGRCPGPRLSPPLPDLPLLRGLCRGPARRLTIQSCSSATYVAPLLHMSLYCIIGEGTAKHSRPSRVRISECGR